jgi:energy-coupling factor transport system substrate-specific component
VSRLVAVSAVLFGGALLAGNGALATLLAAAALVVAGVAWFESGPDSTRELALVATLGSAAAAGRVLFAAIPGVQPVTVVAIVAGAALGARAGAATGALAALVSNLFLGEGIWTPQQMLGWAACGVIGALLSPALRSRWSLAVVSAFLGLAFSASMDVWLWYGFFPHTWAALAATVGRGAWFDVSHAVGNVILALTIGPELRRMLTRYGSRLRAVVVWA